MIKRRELLGATALLAVGGPARAQDFAAMPISLVTPLAAGDAADRAARLMAQELARLLGATVNVVNRPGAGGSLGTQSVIRAAKDGYTLLYAQNSPLTIRRALEPEAANYDPLRDLQPLGLTTRSPSVLVVHRDAPFKTFRDLIAHAAGAGSGLRIGNAGPGSVGELSIDMINTAAGSTLGSVNYKGAAPAVTDLLGGHIDGVILALGAVGAHLRSGSLRGLVISSPLAEFPTIPTLRQLGYKTDILGVWFGFFLPAGVPKPVADRLTTALEDVTRNSAIAAQLLPYGILQEWGSARALADEITSETRAVSELLAARTKVAH